MSRVALCGRRQLLIVDLKEGPLLLAIPEPPAAAKSRDPKHNCAGDVLMAAISPSGRFCAAADDSKRVLVFDLSVFASPRLLTEFPVPRRPSCCTFSAPEDALLVADKSGDVFRAPLAPPLSREPPELLLGHLSIVTDLQMCPNGRLLASADRDEKVRLSRYPNSYNIAAFLLGHRSFVCRIAFSPCGGFLSSAGGDGLLLLWSASGERLARLELSSLAGEEAVPCGLFWRNDRLLVAFEGRSRALMVTPDPAGRALRPAGEIECGGPVRGAFRCGEDVLLLTELPDQRLVLLRAAGERLERAEDEPAIVRANSEFGEQLATAAGLCASFSGLKKAPVDRTGLEMYNERKQEIQKNVLARRTRHQHLKAKRQRQGANAAE